MKEPFDLELDGLLYSVFPEEDDTYTIFKDGVEYIKIQKDEESWIKLDEETDLPIFTEDAEVDKIGEAITAYSE